MRKKTHVSTVRPKQKTQQVHATTLKALRITVLHLLQDCLESGPTWGVHELPAERGIVGCGDAAEESEFVLLRVIQVSVAVLKDGWISWLERTYLAQDVEVADEAQEVEIRYRRDGGLVVQGDAV